MSDITSKVERFNTGRDPVRLALKLQKMRTDPFIFLRGACHLFYENLPSHSVFSKAPVTWICGDLHLENFGSFKGDNRLTYFDINDFDEAVLAPCTWNLLRFLVSVQLGVRSLSVNPADAKCLCHIFIDAYASALSIGKARWVERETAVGLVRELLDGLKERTRPMFLDLRTELKGKRRRIRTDGKKALPVDEKRRASVEALLKEFAKTQENPNFYGVRDVACRIAGTGSLGVERYIVLIEGKGSPDSNYLLDLKQALPSSLDPYLKNKQPKWMSDAERVVTLQNRMQAISMAFLHAVSLDGESYILRSLQPSEDRVALPRWNGKLRRLEEVMTVMGQVTAWAHLRSSGRSGSAIADELIDFGRRTDWQQPLAEAATQRTASVIADWQRFTKANG